MNDRFRRMAARLWGRGQPGLTHEEPPRSSFDDLARDLAQGLSRREALWRFGSGVAGALLASLGLPAVAQSKCPPGTTPCGTTCCNNANGLACCASASQCIGDGFTCCPSTANPRQVCGPGSVCQSGKCVVCPQGTEFCGGIGSGTCCSTYHQRCSKGVCIEKACPADCSNNPCGFLAFCGRSPSGGDCVCSETVSSTCACFQPICIGSPVLCNASEPDCPAGFACVNASCCGKSFCAALCGTKLSVGITPGAAVRQWG